MVENIARYTAVGYVETHREPQSGFQRVFMTKPMEAGSGQDPGGGGGGALSESDGFDPYCSIHGGAVLLVPGRTVTEPPPGVHLHAPDLCLRPVSLTRSTISTTTPMIPSTGGSTNPHRARVAIAVTSIRGPVPSRESCSYVGADEPVRPRRQHPPA